MIDIPLFDYQKDALDRMKNGCILCGGVGSGKSRTSLAYYYKTTKAKVDLYIITTARKRDTHEWEDEFFVFPFKKTKIVIDSWNNIPKYTDVQKAFFIFDEQRVVGSGVWVKSFLKIAYYNQWILLSATPGDTWTDYIPVFVANRFYKNRSEFVREHVVYKRFSKFPQVDRYLNTGLLLKHRNDILVKMDFERTVSINDENVIVKYDTAKYKYVTKNRWDIWNDEPIKNASQFCYALRKIVNTDISRQVSVLELCEKHPKVIIFYNFNYELDILKAISYMPGTSVSEWNGHKHEPIPKSDRWVYLVQYTAGCEGWNCIETDTMIFYSMNYSYKVMEQASGRINRLNTPFETLYYYHLKSNSPIDISIARAIREKRNFNESAFYAR